MNIHEVLQADTCNCHLIYQCFVSTPAASLYVFLSLPEETVVEPDEVYSFDERITKIVL